MREERVKNEQVAILVKAKANFKDKREPNL